jgi:hypothetical protein
MGHAEKDKRIAAPSCVGLAMTLQVRELAKNPSIKHPAPSN